MRTSMGNLVAVSIVLAVGSFAGATMQITEYMYQGAPADQSGEFVEFTNVGGPAVNMIGWSFDDNTRQSGSQDLSAYGTIAPGESVILPDITAADFRTRRHLDDSVKVIGGNANNLGRSDEINLYNGSALVDRLTYNDQATPKQGPRTQGASCNVPAADYSATTALSTWALASVGDSFGSFQATTGDIGSPGRLPEPASLLLLVVGSLMLIRRR